MLKLKPFRSKKYRQWVARLPCCITDYQGPGVDPHHPKGHGLGGSVKCSDAFCIPLAHEIHMELHRIGWESWEAKYNVNQLDFVLRTIELALSEGVLREH
jgi:hypothetical protein